LLAAALAVAGFFSAFDNAVVETDTTGGASASPRPEIAGADRLLDAMMATIFSRNERKQELSCFWQEDGERV
jgi:hypothetical protein